MPLQTKTTCLIKSTTAASSPRINNIDFNKIPTTNSDDESTSDNPKASRSIDRVCYIEYNGMRCNSCREFYKRAMSRALPLIAPISKPTMHHHIPLRAVAHGSTRARRRTNSLDSCALCKLGRLAPNDFDHRHHYYNAWYMSRPGHTQNCRIHHIQYVNPTATPASAADKANSGDPAVSLQEDSGSTASSDNDETLATTK
jgi:hypothetical protein